MARFTAVAAVTNSAHWAAGLPLRYNYFRDEIGQNLEYMMQTHRHAGALGDGGTLATADPKSIWMYGEPPGAAFA